MATQPYGLPDLNFAQLDRAQRKERRELFRTMELKCPRLQNIFLVELTAIAVPGWARSKGIRGLTVTQTTVWLKRIAATKLANLDREAGGDPHLTQTFFRRCFLCDRALLGSEAEARWDLDSRMWGHSIPCGPDCLELQKLRKGKAA